MEMTHYQVLGVAAGASTEQIRHAYGLAVQAFRQRVRETPPPPAGAFDALRLAYQTLVDPARRQRYDESLRAPQPASPDAAPAPVRSGEPAGAAAGEAAGAAVVNGERRHYPFEFVGDGTAYFRIWVVNLVLSILTLGIYSAWAKVRREQFFHRNLLLDGTGFDYHGTPKAILKGRLAAVGVLLVLGLSEKFAPLVYSILTLALIPVFPWLMVRSFRFRAANTSYRGLRFSFDGQYGRAFAVFVGYGLLTLLTLGLCFPLWYRAQRQFVIEHLRFGQTRFSNDLATWPVYRIFLVPFVVTAATLVVVTVTSASGLSGLDAKAAQIAGVGIALTLVGIVFGALVLFGPYVRVRLTNLVWRATGIGPHRVDSALQLRGYLAIAASNVVLIVLTAGIFLPWAQVRMARYRASRTAVMAQGSLEDFVAGERANPAAFGEEFSDLADFDVAL